VGQNVCVYFSRKRMYMIAAQVTVNQNLDVDALSIMSSLWQTVACAQSLFASAYFRFFLLGFSVNKYFIQLWLWTWMSFRCTWRTYHWNCKSKGQKFWSPWLNMLPSEVITRNAKAADSKSFKVLILQKWCPEYSLSAHAVVTLRVCIQIYVNRCIWICANINLYFAFTYEYLFVYLYPCMHACTPCCLHNIHTL
jgi:hypothetical protein